MNITLLEDKKYFTATAPSLVPLYSNFTEAVGVIVKRHKANYFFTLTKH